MRLMIRRVISLALPHFSRVLWFHTRRAERMRGHNWWDDSRRLQLRRRGVMTAALIAAPSAAFVAL